MTEAFTNNTLKHRFELALNGYVAFANYRLQGSTLYIDLVVAPAELRGTGAAGKLMQNIVDTAQKEKLKIVPICPYAAAWMKKNLIQESPTPNPRPYQVRIFLKQEFAEAVNRGETPKEIQPLLDILAKHDARIDHNQFNEFTDYVNNWKTADVPFPDSQREALRDLTKKSLADTEKSSWFKREFTLSLKGETLLNGDKADKLIADLGTLGDGPILIRGKAFAHGPGFETTPVRKTFVPRHHPGT